MPTKKQAAKAKILPEPSTVSDLKASAEFNPDIDPDVVAIWERRFIEPGPEPSMPIPLKDPSWTVRWINTQVEGRFHRATASQGWVPLRAEDLQGVAGNLGFVVNKEGFVCRGERQREVAMKMPTKVFKTIQRRKVEENLKTRRKIKDDMAQSAATEFESSQAGDVVSGFKGTIKEGKETIALDAEGGA
jgi:hypothetical protein